MDRSRYTVRHDHDPVYQFYGGHDDQQEANKDPRSRQQSPGDDDPLPVTDCTDADEGQAGEEEEESTWCPDKDRVLETDRQVREIGLPGQGLVLNRFEVNTVSTSGSKEKGISPKTAIHRIGP